MHINNTPPQGPAVRCSQPLSTNQTPHPTTKDGATTSPIPGFPHSGRRDSGLVVSKPNSVSDDFAAPVFPHQQPTFVVAPEPHPLQARPISRIAQVTEPPQECGRAIGLVVLLRKEVIQPHLPVRLPCYDFVPIADPTFDGSPPYGLGHRLRVLPTFMT